MVKLRKDINYLVNNSSEEDTENETNNEIDE